MREATVAEQIKAKPDLIPSLPDVVTKALQLVDKPGVSLVTSRMLGVFRDDIATRREFLAMIGNPGSKMPQ